MFNVLTKDLKNNIIKNYKTNRLIIFLFFVSFLLMFAIVTLIPSYLFLTMESDKLELENQSIVSSLTTKELNDIKLEFKKNNKYLEFLLSNDKSFDFSAITKSIIKERNESIYFTELSFELQNATTTFITLRGVAKDRKSLLRFSDDLSSEFGQINLPVSNFAKEKDLEFYLDFYITI